jgi:tetratricopeptide (TPR) repeat protein
MPIPPVTGPALVIQRLFLALVILVAGCIVFQPALYGTWLWDDNMLLSDNVALRNLPGLVNTWSGHEEWPLTTTFFWIEWHAFGNNPSGYHFCNLALHLACGLLVWRLLSRLGLRWAWLGGLLFVVHPLSVETGAWISETKNTFSLLLLLLSIDAWLDYDQGHGRLDYARALLFYLAAMLAKTSVVMLPAVLLLHAWWKRGRVERREIYAVAPFFLIALLLGLLTFHMQYHHGLSADARVSGGLLARIGGAGLAWLFYLGRFLAPIGYLPVYPRWSDGTSHVTLYFLALAVMALILGGWWVRRRGWERHAVFGLGFFTLNLAPVLGIVWMRYLNVSPVADHLVYLPMIGLVGLLMAALEQIGSTSRPIARTFVIACASVAMLLLMALSRSEAGLFIDHQTLWTYTLNRNPNAWPALNDLGNDLMDEGHLPEAMALYQRALELDPENADALNNLGNVLARTRHFPEAAEKYNEALRLNPEMVNAHINLGNVYLQTGRTDAAIAEYQTALDLDPGRAVARYNLGNALQGEGHFQEAVQQYDLALKDRPNDDAIWANRGVALQQMGLFSEALKDYEKALELDPQSAENHASLGSALQQLGRNADAMLQYEQALQLDPNLNDVRDALAHLQGAQKPGAPAAK